MMAGPHHDAHLVGNSWTFRIVFVERCSPHGGPEVVCLQAKQQFEDMLVGFRVDAAELVVAPGAERGPFVIDEQAAILHFWRRLNESAILIVERVAVQYGRIGHPIPG